jgi:hypothetical protein
LYPFNAHSLASEAVFVYASNVYTFEVFEADVVGGHHRLIAFRAGRVPDAMKDSLESWNSEDVFLPLLFQILRGFSSFFRNLGPEQKNHAWLRFGP